MMRALSIVGEDLLEVFPLFVIHPKKKKKKVKVVPER